MDAEQLRVELVEMLREGGADWCPFCDSFLPPDDCVLDARRERFARLLEDRVVELVARMALL